MNEWNNLQKVLKNKQRILVIGPNGAGKSTFATMLGESLAINVFHLDKIFWKRNWEHLSEQEFEQDLVGILNSEEPYIIDGDYFSSLKKRVDQADLVIWLKIPAFICIKNIVKRRFKYMFKKRPDMAEGCNEKLSLSFLNYALKYNERSGKPTEILLKDINENNLFIINSNKSFKKYCHLLAESKLLK
ncbi:AAA family ATPase [Listeria seeligeri]|uniref:AAA family ATPase n=1 Tax=Listeria seeligeri TaxID=1640 RepID=UPI0018893205|nr:AAA family ATPase [Listeria seeligeri]MBF2598794.1 AAA family ATPase [Listeria seeligeri]